jgi:site-specific DNA recombinase
MNTRRTALYVRVSTQRQAQQQSSDQQLARLRAWCADHAGDVHEEWVFRDDGVSGSTLRRPGLDALRDAVAAAQCDQIILTTPDRLARNYVHQMLLLEEFERAGCHVEFLDRPMSQDPHDQLLLQIRGAVAEYERVLITERMRRGRLHKLQAGLLLPWSVPPYGYRLGLERPRDPAGVWIEPTEGALVKAIFTRYLTPHSSLDGVAKWLTAQGIPTPTGKQRWRATTLRRMLRNPAYTGQVYAGQTTRRPSRGRQSALRPVTQGMTTQTPMPPATWIAVATIPALVSEEQFAHVQAKLAQNQQAAARHNTVHTYLLRALVSCGHCQLACTGRSLRPDYPYYVCNGKLPPVRSRRREKCPARYIPARQLDALVWQDLCDVLTHPASLTQALAQAQAGAWLPQHLHARRTQLRKGQARVRNQVERLTDAYLNQVMPLEEYQGRRQGLEQHLQALVRQEDQLAADAQRQQDLAGLTQSVEAFCARVQAGLQQATWEQQRQLIELLIDRVVVTDADVEIRYVIPTTPASEHVHFCHLRTDYRARVRLPQRPALSRVLGLRQAAGAHHGVGLRHDVVLAGLQAGRGARAPALGGNEADRSRPDAQANSAADAALALPVLRGDRPAAHRSAGRDQHHRSLATRHGASPRLTPAGTGLRKLLFGPPGNCGMRDTGQGFAYAWHSLLRRSGRAGVGPTSRHVAQLESSSSVGLR